MITSVTTETVLRTGASLNGKPNVTVIKDSSLDGLDTVYINYEPNGDISVFKYPGGGLSIVDGSDQWTTFGVESGSSYTSRSQYVFNGDTTIQIDSSRSIPSGSLLPYPLPFTGKSFALISHYISRTGTTSAIGRGGVYAHEIHYFELGSSLMGGFLFGKHAHGFDASALKSYTLK
jgi:hypothetical protein